jgi:hypothetical protein
VTNSPNRSLRKARIVAAIVTVIVLVNTTITVIRTDWENLDVLLVAAAGWIAAWKALGLAEEWALEASDREGPGGS